MTGREVNVKSVRTYVTHPGDKDRSSHVEVGGFESRLIRDRGRRRQFIHTVRTMTRSECLFIKENRLYNLNNSEVSIRSRRRRKSKLV